MIRFTRTEKAPEPAPSRNDENRFERIRADAAKGRKKPAGGKVRRDKVAGSNPRLL